MGGILQRHCKAAGVRKPSDSQKSKALLKMKAARDRREDYYDSERKDNILGRNTTRLEVWEEHLKRPTCGPGQSSLQCVANQCQGWLLTRDLSWIRSSMAERAQAWCQRCGTNQCEMVFGLIWILGTESVCAQHPRIGMSQRSVDRTVSSSFSL